MGDMAITVEGVAETRAALKSLAPDLHRDLQRVLTGQAQTVAAQARTLIPSSPPLSGWARAWHGDRLRWSSDAVRAGIKGSTARGRLTADGFYSVVVVTQTTAPGQVFELAGRGSGGGAFAGRVTARHGPTSRAVWRAAEAAAQQVETVVTAAVRHAENELNRRIGAGEL